MAATILSGTVTPTGNYTLYTNNITPQQNVRLIIHTLFVHGSEDVDGPYATRRVQVTGGSHGTLSLPISNFMSTFTRVRSIRLQVGKGLVTNDTIEEQGQYDVFEGGVVRVHSNNSTVSASAPQSFPTEIVLRNGQSLLFEASTSTSQQYISFNITVMPEGG